MWCPDCNGKRSDQAIFCSQCGTRLSPGDAMPRQERRHVTVLFCDLVGSTELSARLDPEDYQEVLSSYRETLTRIVKFHAGYVGRILGDGVLAYFGYPTAEEGDAVRAARAALDMSSQVARLSGPSGEQLRVRIGIATGLVLAGDVIGEGVNQELTVSGEIPNLAARLQDLAFANEILLTDDTRRLLGDHFKFEDLGLMVLKGIQDPVKVVRLVEEKQIVSRFLAERGASVGSLVGRETEFARLWNALERAVSGSGQLVQLRGEAGIGKSRLVHELCRKCLEVPVVVMQCSSHQANAVLYPVLQQIANQLQLPDGCADEQKKQAIDQLLNPDDRFSDALPLLYDMMGIGDAPHEHVAAERRNVLDALIAHYLRKPVLLLVEDAHWLDPSTAEFLRLLAAQISTSNMLLIVTHRGAVGIDWLEAAEQIELGPLSSHQSSVLVASTLGRVDVQQDMVQEILLRCDGNPLYLEELSKHLIEQRGQTEIGREIPDSLQDTLMARLDRLGAAKRYVQIGAMLGRSFPLSVLAGVSSVNSDELSALLDRAIDSEVIVAVENARTIEYAFRHALIQDAAYASLTHRERRRMHGIAAQHMCKSNMANSEPYLVAHHFERAGEFASAAEFWEAAGVRATERSANLEAIHYLKSAIRIIEEQGLDRSRELDLRVRMTGALRATIGYSAPQVGAAVEEVLSLSRKLGRTDITLNAINGLYSFHLVRSSYGRAGELARELLDTAEKAGDATYEMIGHRAVGIVAFHLGRLSDATSQMQQALDCYRVEDHLYLAKIYGSDHASTVGNYLSLARWVSGQARAALALQNRTVAHARTIEHAHSIAQSVAYRALLHCMNRDWANVTADCAFLVPYAQSHGLRLMELFGQVTSGIARAQQSRTQSNVEAMLQAIEALDKIAPHALQPYLLTEAATVLIRDGRFNEAGVVLDRAQQISASTSEVWASAETCRVRSAKLFMEGDVDGADCELVKASTIALEQGAHMWQFRIALDAFDRTPGENSRRMLHDSVGRIQQVPQDSDVQYVKLVLNNSRVARSRDVASQSS